MSVEVLLMDAQDDPPQGGGEPAIICMGGAIANAVFDCDLHQIVLPDRMQH